MPMCDPFPAPRLLVIVHSESEAIFHHVSNLTPTNKRSRNLIEVCVFTACDVKLTGFFLVTKCDWHALALRL